MNERWLPVPNYPDYEVSDLGRVWSYKKGGRYLKASPKRRGRPTVAVSNSEGRRDVFIHTLVLEAFVGPRPSGLQACHGNDIRTDNRLENLRWGTQSDNVLDRIRNGIDNGPTSTNSRKTECPRGHVLKEPNLRKRKLEEGHRSCLACHDLGRHKKESRSWEELLEKVDSKYFALTGLEPNYDAPGRRDPSNYDAPGRQEPQLEAA